MRELYKRADDVEEVAVMKVRLVALVGRGAGGGGVRTLGVSSAILQRGRACSRGLFVCGCPFLVLSLRLKR